MYRSEIIYYGPPGLEADIFEKAMTNLGFWVERAERPAELLKTVDSHPKAIAVVAIKWSKDELEHLLLDIRQHQGDGTSPIFVIDSSEKVDPFRGVRFVPASQRLRGTVNGIGEYVRNMRGGPAAANAHA